MIVVLTTPLHCLLRISKVHMGWQRLLVVFFLMLFGVFCECCRCGELCQGLLDVCVDGEVGHDSKAYPLHHYGFVSLESSPSKVVNVENYGAKGDGNDDTEAFVKAWKQACSSSAPVVLYVPKQKSYLLNPIIFSGPCKSNISFMIKGTIQASPNRSDWDGENRRHWILFNEVNNLKVGGGGTVNGNGENWWQNSCKVNKHAPCTDAPTAVTFYKCNNLKADGLTVKNGQQVHVSFERCSNVDASSIAISAPENSPKTDGIHVTGTKNIDITSCVIGTGDDCISIVSGSEGVRAMNITCGPGHGISIGSLGAQNSEDYVSDVLVDTTSLSGTTTGVRIKTWQGGKGYVRNIRFQNIKMNNVQNPIIIDQNYCDSEEHCQEQKTAVEISNIQYKNIKGTSATEVAIDFDCSKSVPCQDIVLQNISLVRQGGEAAQSSFKNVKWTTKGDVRPIPGE